MPDVGNLNPDRKSESAIKRGVTRQHFDKLFEFDKEHTEPTRASSSQLREHINIVRDFARIELKDTFECRTRLVAPLRDAQVKIWRNWLGLGGYPGGICGYPGGGVCSGYCPVAGGRMFYLQDVQKMSMSCHCQGCLLLGILSRERNISLLAREKLES